MKVIIVDNFNRETISDRLYMSNLTADESRRIANEYNNKREGDAHLWFALAVKDEHVLYDARLARMRAKSL